MRDMWNIFILIWRKIMLKWSACMSGIAANTKIQTGEVTYRSVLFFNTFYINAMEWAL
jgi:hypothetical protein